MASETAWPPSSGLSTPTVSRADAILTLASSITISAPADQVFNVLLDTTTYPSWCTFIPRVVVNSQPPGIDPSSLVLHLGTEFTFYAIMDASKPHKDNATHLRILDMSTPERHSQRITKETLENDQSYASDLNKVYRVSWGCDGKFTSMEPRVERIHEIVVIGKNECEVRNWEVMSGVLARAVKWLYKDNLQGKFEEWNKDLKTFCEKRVTTG